MEDNLLFSTRDIVAIYPNNLGLRRVLSQFIMQMKIRPVKHGMIRINSNSPQIRIAYYNINKLKQTIEEYIVKVSYKLCGERKQNLNIILEIVNNKISEGENK